MHNNLKERNPEITQRKEANGGGGEEKNIFIKGK
jgi:hypothetical protein